MNKSNWIIIVLSAALAAVSARLAIAVNDGKEAGPDVEAATGATSGAGSNESALQCIMTRSSVREYSDRVIPDSIMEKLLKAGMAAPTAMNLQPWQMVVVSDDSLKRGIAEKMPNAAMAERASRLIVVCGDMGKTKDGEGKEYWVQDCSAATENILLAAHALGIGSVWCGVYPISERVKMTQQLLNLPAHLVPLDVICLGYPAGTPAVKDKWNPEAVHYNRF